MQTKFVKISSEFWSKELLERVLTPTYFTRFVVYKKPTRWQRIKRPFAEFCRRIRLAYKTLVTGEWGND